MPLTNKKNEGGEMRFDGNLHLYREEIKSFNFSLSAKEIDDFARISYLLTQEDLVIKQVEKLNKKLFDDACCKGIFEQKELTKKLFDINNTEKFKLLSDVLYRWAVENKLNTQMGKINRLLSNARFHSLLCNGTLFKDLGVPREHGPWSHYLQWFIIIEANKDDKFLENDPYELYKLLGSQRSFGQKQENKTSLWYLCFDRYEVTNQFDCRSPDNLNSLIKNNYSNKFPLLSAILKKGFKNIFLAKDTPTISYKNCSEQNQNRIVKYRRG